MEFSSKTTFFKEFFLLHIGEYLSGQMFVTGQHVATDEIYNSTPVRLHYKEKGRTSYFEGLGLGY